MILNSFDLTGRTILATGASSGIVRETRLPHSQLNARIILPATRGIDRQAQPLAEPKADLVASDGCHRAS